MEAIEHEGAPRKRRFAEEFKRDAVRLVVAERYSFQAAAKAVGVSERVERSFAHVCETGGARRTWLCGIDKVRKRYLIAALARNLGVMMRALFNIGTPRGLQAEGKAADVLAALARLAQLAAPLRWTALTLLQTIHDAQPLRRGNHHPLATAA